jgi:hypothetical protein
MTGDHSVWQFVLRTIAAIGILGTLFLALTFLT